MTSAAWRLVARATAIAIAIAALIDPVWSISRPIQRHLVAINLASDISNVVDRLRARTSDWQVAVRDAAGGSLPCGADEHCVIVADGSRDVEIPADLRHPLSLVALTHTSTPNVTIRSTALSATHLAATGTARVSVERRGSIGATEIRVIDSGAVIGSATHKWQDETSASVDVAWWPLDAGARMLRIEAMAAENETSVIDNAIDVGIDVTRSRMPVLVFDARPSWLSTFVRRALEDDPRFTVGHRARVAPSVSAGTTNARLDAAALDAAAVTIAGGPDALTAGDVELLERFVRVRGGTLVLLPEQRPAGPIERLMSGTWSEHLTQLPERIGPLYAAEILRTADRPLSTVIGRSGSVPAIVSAPSGAGRVVISGAMDAWRYRDKDAGAFDRFWRSLAAEGAAAGASLSLSFDTPLTTAGTSVRFVIRDRRMQPATSVEAAAVLRCNDQPANTIRLWPSGPAGEFIGETAMASTGSCLVEASVNGRSVAGGIAVASQPRRGTIATLAKLERAARATGGAVASAGDESRIVGAIDAQRQPASQIVSARPMRALWWIIPFAGCLTAEWWLRRREGLR